MKKCSNDELNHLIKIQFVGEPAVDQGGRRNEFFSLVHSEVSNSGMFIGKENRKCFNHDILALEQRSFYIYMGSYAILQSWKANAFSLFFCTFGSGLYRLCQD